MESSLKLALFAQGRESMSEAGITAKMDKSLICPLCWEETLFEDLSIEHIVPGSVGGNRKTLTCRKCNNDQGSDLDAHLKNFQRTKDAFKGHGSLPVKMDVNGKRMVANLEWNEKAKNFIVVGKASDERAIAAIQDDFRDNKVSEISVTLMYGYAVDNFHRAVLRSAYLVLFERFGYSYAHCETVQSLRRRICDGTLSEPHLTSLIVELRTANMPYDCDYLILPRRIEETDCFLVIVRAKGFSTSYFGAYFPSDSNSIAEFVSLMDECKRKNDRKQVTVAESEFLPQPTLPSRS